jgi:hypothetical protein
LVPYDHYQHLHNVLKRTAAAASNSNASENADITMIDSDLEALYMQFDCPQQKDNSSCGPFLLHLIQRLILKPRTLCSTLSVSGCNLNENKKKPGLYEHSFDDTRKKEEMWDLERLKLKRYLLAQEVDIILEYTPYF